MIRLTNFSFHYPGTAQKCLDRVSFEVKEGECVLICGQSGCGKSTLCRVINGLCPKFYEGEVSGEYHLCEKNVDALSLDEIGLTIGSVFQDPRSQFFAKRVRDEIVLAMENNCVSRESMKTRLLEVSDLLGIGELHDREMSGLSSGEKQKVAIASVFAPGPRGLVLDEPSANLDTNSTVQLGLFLQTLKARGHTLIISEHRLHYLTNVFDRMIILENGKITAEFSRAQALALTEAERLRFGLRSFELPEFGLDKGAAATSEFLQAERISLRLADQQILNDTSLGVRPGEIAAVTGSNGAGKTSLCRIITGIQKETTGMVQYRGKPTRHKARTKNSFFVQQDVDYQLYTPTVREEILMASQVTAKDVKFCETVSLLGLEPVLDRHPNTLSGGQKQRVLIAAAILRDAPLMVLDEPTSGLDGKNMAIVSSILGEIANDGKGILLVTHDVEFIARAADTLAYLHASKVKYNRYIKRS